MNLNIFSDLRKPGLVPGESLSLSTNINSALEKKSNLQYVKQNEKSSYAQKMFFFQASVIFLAHVSSADGISANPDKVEKVNECRLLILFNLNKELNFS